MEKIKSYIFIKYVSSYFTEKSLKRVLSGFFTLFFFTTSSAQFISKSTNDTLNNYSEARQLYHSSNHLFYTSIKYNYSSGLTSLVIIKSDTLLNTLWSKNISLEEIVSIDNLFELSDSSILLNGFCYNDSTDKVYNVLINFNQDGDTLWTRNLSDQQRNMSLIILNVFADSLLLYGSIADSIISGVLLSFDLASKTIQLSSKYSVINELELRIVKAQYDSLNNNIVAIFLTSDPSIPINSFHLARIELNRDVKTLIHLFDQTSGYPLLKIDPATSNIFAGTIYSAAGSGNQNYFYSLLDSNFNVIYAHELYAPIPLFRNLTQIFFNSTGSIFAFDSGRSYEFNTLGIADSVYRLFAMPNWPNTYYPGIFLNSNNCYYALGIFRKQLQNILNNLTISKGEINTVNSCLGNPLLNLYTTTSFTPTGRTAIQTGYSGIQINYPVLTVSNDNIIFYDNCNITSAEEPTASENNLTIYPNPFSDYFILEGLVANREYQLTFINAMGSMVASQIISNVTSKKIDCLKSLPGDVYTLIISTTDNVVVKKLVKP